MPDQRSSADAPFSFFVSLIEHISRIKPRKGKTHGHKVSQHWNSSVVRTFRNWVAELHRRYDPLPPGTTAIIFRLLFPEDDVKRKYDMQEARLAQTLAGVLGLSGRSHGRGEGLVNWKSESAIGCLGLEVRGVLEQTHMSLGDQVGIAEVDALLSTLARKSAFSADTVRNGIFVVPSLKDHTRHGIIRTLYSRLSPSEASVVTQIILKDLRPLLYPLPQDETHYTTLLMHYKSNALEQLSKFDAMRAWDPSGRMLSAYRVRACLDEAGLAYELTLGTSGPPLAPKVGTPIQIPKCSKGQGCMESLRLLRGSKKIWAETKYDGERTQIHVEFSASCPRITIYSKSGRDSTMDRVAIHPLVLDAIGFGSPSCMVKNNVVLEAEMVAFSETLQRVDEFWRIRSLISTTAIGPRHSRHPKHTFGNASQDTMDGSQCSLVSNASDDGTRHLALVFFDVLVLDDVSLLSSPYSARRETLESLLRLKSGHVMLAQRVAIDMRPRVTARGREPELDPEAFLRKVFAGIIADHQEGLVLKADEAPYNDWKIPWVKLKKDYIVGYGDTLDLVLVGAAWEKERARELRVAPTAYTTFYIGVLANAAAVKSDPRCISHFEIFFTASYGLSREDLEQLNFRIKSSDPVHCEPGKIVHGLPYTYNLFKGLPPPVVLLPIPILAEVAGGSFTKAAHSKFYELRFPRIVKVFRSNERPWTDAAKLDEFQQIARESVGHERSHKDVEDWCNVLWGRPSSPGVKCPVKRQRTEDEWAEKLERADRKVVKRARKAGAEQRYNGRPEDTEEENREPLLESPTFPRPWGTLSSVTNVLRASPASEVESPHRYISSDEHTPVANVTHLTSPPPTVPRLRHSVSNEKHIASTRPKCFEQSEHVASDDSVDPRVSAERASAADRRDATYADVDASTEVLTLDDLKGNIPQAVGFHSTPLGHFLRDAVVWLAKPRSTPRPAWRVPSKLIFPAGQQVHSLESLLQACLWGTDLGTFSCDWAKKGVIFINDTPEVQESSERLWTEWPLRFLMERRSTLLRGERVENLRSVWVFSMRMLSYDTLNEPCSDVEARALCRFG